LPGNLSPREAVLAALKDKPDGVLESIADTHGVSYADVLDCLPVDQCIAVPGERFDEIWQELTGWGAVMFIVHTINGVIEVKAELPPGEHGRGYFNIHGSGPLGGHLRIARCARICFLDRPFFGRRSCSIQVIDRDGAAMFKIFVARDANRELVPDQLERFDALKVRMAERGTSTGPLRR
jgi:putative heme utilization carrier protein HutX